MYWTIRPFLSVIAAALLISVILFTPASADSGEARLLSGSSRSWQIELDQETTLAYDLKVEVGDRIDVFLMTAPEHQAFERGEPFSFIAGGSFTDAREVSAELVLGPGTYYLVAASASAPAGSLTEDTLVSYTINVETTSESSTLQTILTVGAAAILFMVLFILFDTLRRNKSHKEDEDERRQ